MQGNKILLSAWSAGLVFCLLQLIWGPQGVIKTQELKLYQIQLDIRLAALQEENQTLSRHYEALRTSADAVRLEARKLGWFQKGEIPVRVVSGPSFGQPPQEERWTVLERPGDDENLDTFFRAAWFLLFLFFYLVFFFFEKVGIGRLRFKKFFSQTRLPKDDEKSFAGPSLRPLPLIAVRSEETIREVEKPSGPIWKADWPQIRDER